MLNNTTKELNKDISKNAPAKGRFYWRHRASAQKGWNTLYILILALVASAALASFLISMYLNSINDFDWSSTITHQTEPRSHRILDGKLVAEDKTELKPIAIILENHYDSRPISGLDQASIIYEIIIEGDITRFLAIFDSDFRSKKVGPVRSVRPFFVTLAQEWDPVYFHAGGSSAGLTQLRNSSIYNIDEISANGIYFWRDSSKTPPHNLYTSANQIKRVIAAKEINTQADFSPWLFKNDSSNLAEKDFKDIEINFSANPLYKVKYIYNKKNNDYTRHLAGKVHKTDQGIILKANNIVVQHVDYDIIDDYGRLYVDVYSSGKAEIYQDGRVINGDWRRRRDKTRFYNEDGQEVKFNRGNVWVELVFN